MLVSSGIQREQQDLLNEILCVQHPEQCSPIPHGRAQPQEPSSSFLHLSRTHHLHLCPPLCFSGEGNGNPLQYFCLENPVDRGAWWAAVHRVAQSQTQMKRLSMHACIREGNGNPLQCSCLENPRDRGAWWAAICGIAQSQTRLKRLSSSSRSCISQS